jgi:hypothetical protein
LRSGLRIMDVKRIASCNRLRDRYQSMKGNQLRSFRWRQDCVGSRERVCPLLFACVLSPDSSENASLRRMFDRASETALASRGRHPRRSCGVNRAGGKMRHTPYARSVGSSRRCRTAVPAQIVADLEGRPQSVRGRRPESFGG